MRPSSKASLEAAASSTPSDDSHPPFGTGETAEHGNSRSAKRRKIVKEGFKGVTRGSTTLSKKRERSTHRPSYLAVSDW